MMFKTGLLIITKPLGQVRPCIPAYLAEINRLISKTIYIHLQPSHNSDLDQLVKAKFVELPFTSEVRNIVKDFYSSGASVCSDLDIRVLLGNITNQIPGVQKYNLSHACELVIIDEAVRDGKTKELLTSLGTLFNITDEASIQSLKITASDTKSGDKSDPDNGEAQPKRIKLDETEVKQDNTPIEQYAHTVLGGTFDRLHTGHKLLLSEGCLLATNSLTVGVTDGVMNQKKTLCELILPVNTRLDGVRNFLEDVKPTLEYKLVPITDAFGPSITDPDLGLIVLSQETKKGGEMINVEREKKGMQRLEEYTIGLLEDTCHSQYEEEKISSSSERKRLLGTLLQPLKPSTSVSDRPYIIGLTGGIASGKSSICKRLEGLGAASVDCDKLGHRAYVKGSPGFDKVVQAFGSEVVGSDGEVDRKVLGKIVFSDKSKLELLNQIVWPEIAQLARQEIQRLTKEGHTVIVLEAAILLEASWDAMTHEVWTTIIPPAEAIKRLVERNKLSEDQAQQRLSSQLSNMERVARSNVILSSLWEYEYTQSQVEKAWDLLMKRIGQKSPLVPKANM